MEVVGAIELGGTKTVCGIVTADGKLLERTSFPTTEPRETLRRAARFLSDRHQRHGDLQGVGIVSFGPLCIDKRSADYGQILKTPKPGWSGTNVYAVVRDLMELPVGLDTDVNGALRAEAKWGACVGHANCVYVTVGTGIGAGVMVGGAIVGESRHPEVGHMMLPRCDDDREFAGSCSFHAGRCAEGLASGPAIAQRWGRPGAELDSAHPAWDLEARYLAALCVNLTLALLPSRIVLGGGVLRQPRLIDAVRAHLSEFINGYVEMPSMSGSVVDLVVAPGLGEDAGVLGAAAVFASQTGS